MLQDYYYIIISVGAILFLFFLYILNQLRKRHLANEQRKTRKKWKNAHYNSLRGNFVVVYDTPIEDQYEIEKELILGQGSFGIVVVGKNKETGIKYAIKFIHKSSDESKRLEREVKLLKDVDHINIVGLFAVYETAEQVGFVMELCTGGHLGRFLEKMPGKFLQEEHAKIIIRQLLSAIAHMHARGICHRDIKLQNILMENQSINSQIKLIDFGFGTRFIGATPLKTRCGTPYTTAPEVFQESYDERCDVWSAGVVAYTVICGKRPFQALVIPGELENAAKTTLVTNILMCRYHFNYPQWKKVSTMAIDFVQKMLHPDYRVRWHAKDALLHEWLGTTDSLTSKHEKYKNGFHMEGLDRVLMNLKRTSMLSSLHQTSMLAVVFSQPPRHSEKLRSLFQDFDTDSNGTLSIDEFVAALQILSNKLITEEDAKKLFEAIDVNHDEQISFTEFLAATLDPREVDPDALNKAFELLDVEKKGFITVSDLERVMDAKYIRNRKMSEKFNVRQSITGRDVKIVTPQPAINEDASHSGNIGEHKFLPMSHFNFLRKKSKTGSITPEHQLIDDSGVSMDSDLSKSKDQPKPIQRKSFSLAKSFLQADFPDDEDDVDPKEIKKSETIGDVFDPVIAERIRDIFLTCDVNHDGVISYSEFLWAMADGDGLFQKEEKQDDSSSEEDDPDKMKLRRGSSMPVIKQDEKLAQSMIEPTHSPLALQYNNNNNNVNSNNNNNNNTTFQQPISSTASVKTRRNTSYVTGASTNTNIHGNSNVNVVSITTLADSKLNPQFSSKSGKGDDIFRIPTNMASKESEVGAIVRYPSVSKGAVEQDQLDFSISSLCLEKDDVWSIPSSSPFLFDQKFSDVSSSNQDSDIELGIKSSKNSRGRLGSLPGPLKDFFPSQPKKDKKRTISSDSIDSIASSVIYTDRRDYLYDSKEHKDNS